MDYTLLAEQIRALAESEPCWLPVLSNTSAAIFETMDDLNWAGFYLVDNAGTEQSLLLGPFQGKTACIRIAYGKGVCGTALKEDAVQLVPDVHAFPGHIACDSASNSEIVLPVHSGGEIKAVLDIDSPSLARFSEEDRDGLLKVVAVLEELVKW